MWSKRYSRHGLWPAPRGSPGGGPHDHALLAEWEELRAVAYNARAPLMADMRRRAATVRGLQRMARGVELIAEMECHGDEAQLDRELGRTFAQHRQVSSIVSGVAVGGIVAGVAGDMPEMETIVQEVAPGRALCGLRRVRGLKYAYRPQFCP